MTACKQYDYNLGKNKSDKKLNFYRINTNSVRKKKNKVTKEINKIIRKIVSVPGFGAKPEPSRGDHHGARLQNSGRTMAGLAIFLVSGQLLC